jgi:glycosyltransferase involved in cell wall biosynthesis
MPGEGLVHTHLVHADWHGALAVANQPSVPLVSTKHNHDPFRGRRLFATVEQLVARRVDEHIAISDSLRAYVERHHGISATVVHYGLQAGPARAAGGGRPVRRLLAVGRLERQKGFDVLIDSLSAFEFPDDLSVRIAGEGSLRGALEARVRSLGLSDTVEFLGWRTDVADLLAEADLLVHPARWEGFGLVLLEAMRAAVPIVATSVGAIPEVVIDGETGMLVAPDDANALGAAIASLVADPPRASALAVAGHKRLLEAFSPVRMATETVSVYESALAARARRRAPLPQPARQVNTGRSAAAAG